MILQISSERISNLWFAACHRAKEENKTKIRIFSENSSEVKHSYSENSNIDDLSRKNEDHGDDEADSFLNEEETQAF